jgi:hypothetical protein
VFGPPYFSALSSAKPLYQATVALTGFTLFFAVSPAPSHGSKPVAELDDIQVSLS